MLIFEFGTAYGTKLGIIERKYMCSLLFSYEISRNNRICGLLHGMPLGQEDITLLGYSVILVDGEVNMPKV